MSEQKTKVRYNYDLLKKYCDENGIDLKKDYSNETITRDTIIEAKCLNCDDNCSKVFRHFINVGCYCRKHTKENRNEKVKSTCMKKFGVEYPSQNKEVRDKQKATCFEKFGVENPSQSKEVREKAKATNLERFGVENPSQSKEVRDKQKATCLKNFGVEYSMQSKEVKEKSKVTMLEKYGVEHALQNSEISENASKNAYKAHDYTFPSGRIERIQGYENHMLNDLLEKEQVHEDDIVVNRSDVPPVWYEDLNGKQRRYFVDCFIKSQNRCIEAKSTWTADKKQDCIYLKQQATKDLGYKCEIWIYDADGEIVEKIE